MVGLRLLVAVALATGLVSPLGAGSMRLPAASFQDQEGRTLSLEALQGRVVVIVYGTRAGIPHHLSWGQRLDADLRALGVYRAEDAMHERPVQILALAQMGGIPEAFRGIIRAFVRDRTPKGHSLWLDWEDRMSALFGIHESASTVLVADRDGSVRLVVSGLPEGEPYRKVTELLRQLT